METQIYDVLIIGAGPVGLYTGYYCGLRKLKTLICDSLAYCGGQLYNLYPEKQIYDLPGFVSISAKQFIENLLTQIETVEHLVNFQLETTVTQFIKTADYFEVYTNQQSIYAKSIILASGNGSFQPRTLGLAEEQHFENIYYYVNQINQFKDKVVTIFGGGDSAVDWALMLNRVAKTVTIVHRREEFRAKQVIVDALKQSNIQIITSHVAKKLIGSNQQVQAIELEQINDQTSFTLETEAIIVNYGVILANSFLKQSALNLEAGKIIVNQQLETNLPGVFACGDVCYYPGREVQITTGLGEGLTASAMVFHYLYPAQKSLAIR